MFLGVTRATAGRKGAGWEAKRPEERACGPGSVAVAVAESPGQGQQVPAVLTLGTQECRGPTPGGGGLGPARCTQLQGQPGSLGLALGWSEVPQTTAPRGPLYHACPQLPGGGPGRSLLWKGSTPLAPLPGPALWLLYEALSLKEGCSRGPRRLSARLCGQAFPFLVTIVISYWNWIPQGCGKAQ